MYIYTCNMHIQFSRAAAVGCSASGPAGCGPRDAHWAYAQSNLPTQIIPTKVR